MRRALAYFITFCLLADTASAETSLYSFPFDEPPAALTGTGMAVLDGETTVRLTFGGDCTLGGETAGARRFSTVMEQEGYAYPFANLLPLFAADDLTLVNLEGVLSDRHHRRVPKQYNFLGESQYAQILSLGGVEGVTLANNHALDYGAAGKRDTQDALTAEGIGWCDADRVLVLDKDGVRVGVTGSGQSLNRNRWLEQAEALRALGCVAIVHMMHMGREYADTLTAGQRSAAAFFAENGVTLVVGSHPHVAQGVGVYGRTAVAFSLGNCVFGGNTDPEDYDACVLSVSLRFEDGALADTQITLWPIRVSTDTARNDYQPALLAGEDAQRVLDKMQATSGYPLAPFADGQGAVQPRINWR